MLEIVAVHRRHGIGMEDELPCPAGKVGGERTHGGAGGLFALLRRIGANHEE